MSTVAEYLAWARKAPDVNHSLVLQTLEARVRETVDAAASNHWAAFQRFKKALSDRDCARKGLDALENDLKQEATDTAEFFKTHYDIQFALSQQR
jgi:hypothetical protein